MSSENIIIAFDLYGTLLSTSSIAAKLGSHFGTEVGNALAATWRNYQLNYTFRMNSMGSYEPFSTITRRSLHHTLAENKLSLNEQQIEELMQAYDDLSIFEDVAPALEALKSESGITAVIFSNGTQSMVSNSVYRSKGLSPFQDIFKDIVVVEEVKKFKPTPEVYNLLARKMGKSIDEKGFKDMWLVSGNSFDILGARAVGMQAAWVDRAGKGWTDRLISGNQGRPTVVVKALGEVIDAVRKHTSK